MPEGPSILILKEALLSFEGKKVVEAEGSLKTFDTSVLVGRKIVEIRTWGKHFLISFGEFSIRVHLMMFGTYSINERKPNRIPKLRLTFSRNKEFSFYACSISRIDKPLDEVYDWSADIMNDDWSYKGAVAKLKKHPKMIVADALLDQDIFSGSGNIIKNEVLYRIKVHPKSVVGKLTPVKLRSMVEETVNYSFQFLEWKRAFVLKKHWLAYTKKKCGRDGHDIMKEYMGKGNRRTFYCPVCQKLYK